MTAWLSWEPLEAFCERYGADSHRSRADLLDTPVGTLRKWKDDGRLPEPRADEVACAMGVHPSAIWPEWEHLTPPTLDLDDDLSDLKPTKESDHAHA